MTMMRQKTGLTLTEMLLALAIASLLLAATLRVITAASRSSDMSRTVDEHPPWQSQLKRLLEMDILHADSYRQTSNSIEMKLRSSLDKNTLGLKHQSSIVAYRAEEIDGRNWLIRTQRQKTDIWRELVAADVKMISTDTLDGSIEPETWQKISEKFALNIEFSDEQKLPIRVNCIFK